MSAIIHCDGCGEIVNSDQPYYKIDTARELRNVIPPPSRTYRSVPLRKIPVVKGDFCGLACINIKFAKESRHLSAMNEAEKLSMQPVKRCSD